VQVRQAGISSCSNLQAGGRTGREVLYAGVVAGINGRGKGEVVVQYV